MSATVGGVERDKHLPRRSRTALANVSSHRMQREAVGKKTIPSGSTIRFGNFQPISKTDPATFKYRKRNSFQSSSDFFVVSTHLPTASPAEIPIRSSTAMAPRIEFVSAEVDKIEEGDTGHTKEDNCASILTCAPPASPISMSPRDEHVMEIDISRYLLDDGESNDHSDDFRRPWENQQFFSSRYRFVNSGVSCFSYFSDFGDGLRRDQYSLADFESETYVEGQTFLPSPSKELSNMSSSFEMAMTSVDGENENVKDVQFVPPVMVRCLQTSSRGKPNGRLSLTHSNLSHDRPKSASDGSSVRNERMRGKARSHSVSPERSRVKVCFLTTPIQSIPCNSRPHAPIYAMHHLRPVSEKSKQVGAKSPVRTYTSRSDAQNPSSTPAAKQPKTSWLPFRGTSRPSENKLVASPSPMLLRSRSRIKLEPRTLIADSPAKYESSEYSEVARPNTPISIVSGDFGTERTILPRARTSSPVSDFNHGKHPGSFNSSSKSRISRIGTRGETFEMGKPSRQRSKTSFLVVRGVNSAADPITAAKSQYSRQKKKKKKFEWPKELFAKNDLSGSRAETSLKSANVLQISMLKSSESQPPRTI